MIQNYADHSANERTFLAWVRTTIAIVGFGIAGSRLGPVAGTAPDVTSTGWADAVILAAGVLVIALAYLRMRLVRARIDTDEKKGDEGGRADLMLAVLVIAFFGLLGSFALRLSI